MSTAVYYSNVNMPIEDGQKHILPPLAQIMPSVSQLQYSQDTQFPVKQEISPKFAQTYPLESYSNALHIGSNSSSNSYPNNGPMIPISTEKCTCRSNVNRIPRPRNAFILFRQKYHQSVLDEGSVFRTNPEVSRELGRRWRNLSVPEKDYWNNLADEEKQNHAKKYPGYRYTPRRNGKSKDCQACKHDSLRQQQLQMYNQQVMQMQQDMQYQHQQHQQQIHQQHFQQQQQQHQQHQQQNHHHQQQQPPVQHQHQQIHHHQQGLNNQQQHSQNQYERHQQHQQQDHQQQQQQTHQQQVLRGSSTNSNQGSEIAFSNQHFIGTSYAPLFQNHNSQYPYQLSLNIDNYSHEKLSPVSNGTVSSVSQSNQQPAGSGSTSGQLNLSNEYMVPYPYMTGYDVNQQPH